MGTFLVGCDVGTSATKSVVIDESGAILGKKTIGYPTLTNSMGWAEHDPEVYWATVSDTISEAIKEAGIDASEIKGVSISAHSPACILIDKDLKPLQLSHFWMDRRGTAEAEYINNTIGEDRVFKVSANVCDPYYATVKLLWEKNNRKDLYDRAYKFQTAADYPRMKLTGKLATDYSNASLIGVAFDIVNKKWDTDMLEEIGLDPDKFPQLYACDEYVGDVTSEAAKRCGLKAGTPVFAGTVDCNAAWVAGGALEDGDISLVMGSAGVLGVVHEEPRFTKNLITIVHAANSKKTYTTLAAICGCGAGFRYYKEQFAPLECIVAKEMGMNEYDYLCQRAATIPVGSEGLITVPYFMGERTPIWNPIARGIVFGMSLAHTRDHMLRSFLEGAALALKHNFELIQASNIKMNFPIVMGEGGAQSPLWRQIVCDCLKVPGVYMSDAMGAPVGNAIIAGVGSGVFKDYSVVKDWVSVSNRTDPISKNSEIYDDLYSIYRKLYEQVKDDYPELSEIVKKIGQTED
jgi:xylulokinase